MRFSVRFFSAGVAAVALTFAGALPAYAIESATTTTESWPSAAGIDFAPLFASKAKAVTGFAAGSLAGLLLGGRRKKETEDAAG